MLYLRCVCAVFVFALCLRWVAFLWSCGGRCKGNAFTKLIPGHRGNLSPANAKLSPQSCSCTFFFHKLKIFKKMIFKTFCNCCLPNLKTWLAVPILNSETLSLSQIQISTCPKHCWLITPVPGGLILSSLAIYPPRFWRSVLNVGSPPKGLF